MARAQYFVSPIVGGWKVTHGGISLSTHATKQPAIDAGVAAAKKNQPSQLKIQKLDGTIEDERTYEGDPYPPRG
ncbi:MAG: hypothetical protein JWQ39_611 [Glaciihabitans sp.]|nr:hypothetical protein [Glaciihabitans sp.]